MKRDDIRWMRGAKTIDFYPDFRRLISLIVAISFVCLDSDVGDGLERQGARHFDLWRSKPLIWDVWRAGEVT
jgi:hypothetical protein